MASRNQGFLPRLDLKARQILLFMESAGVPVTYKDLACQLALSPREISYRIPQIEMWLDEHDLALVDKPETGLSVSHPPDRPGISDIIKDGWEDHFYYGPEERQDLLFFYALTRDHPFTIRELSSQFCVSRSTIIADLDAIENHALKLGLHLIRKRNYGMEIIGTERAFRRSVRESLLRIINEHTLIKLCRGGNWDPDAFGPIPIINDYLKNIPLQGSLHFVENIEELLDIKYGDSSKLRLALHTAIVIKQLSDNHYLQVDLSSELANRNDQQKDIVLKAFIDQFNIEPPREELDLLLTQLLITERLDCSTYSDIQEKNQHRENQELCEELHRNLIEHLAKTIHPYLHIDQTFQNDFYYLLKVLLQRFEFGHVVENAYREKFRKGYPNIYASISSGLSKHAPCLEISDDDISNLGMLVVAALENLHTHRKLRVIIICSAGLAGSRLLANRLVREFTNIEIVSTLSALELDKLTEIKHNIDLVITTVKPQFNPGIPVLVISPFLDSDDLSIMESALEKFSDHKPLKVEEKISLPNSTSLLSLLTLDTVETGLYACTWLEAVKIASQALQKTGAILNSYVDAIIHSLNTYGPYMVLWPQIALLHAHPEDGVRHNGLSLHTFTTPVPFGKSPDQHVRLIFTFATLNSQLALATLQEISYLLSQEEFLERALSASGKAELLEVIYAHMMPRCNIKK